MKAIDFLALLSNHEEMAADFWIEPIWSERELRLFESNAIRKSGGVKINNDYFCTYKRIPSIPADAIYSIPEYDVLVYCYKIDGVCKLK